MTVITTDGTMQGTEVTDIHGPVPAIRQLKLVGDPKQARWLCNLIVIDPATGEEVPVHARVKSMKLELE